jgi:hypothetical protein
VVTTSAVNSTSEVKTISTEDQLSAHLQVEAREREAKSKEWELAK